MSQGPEAPPSYAQATGSSTSSHPPRSHLDVPGHNGIPAAHRRSMEDENRPLPEGWIRQFDSNQQHQFFVDTKADPPRSIWHHPYDDEQYLATLTSEERERIQESEQDVKKKTDHLDLTDDETSSPVTPSKPASSFAEQLPPRSDGGRDDGKKPTFGRKMKDKLTGTTHDQRVADRARRDAEEKDYYEAHQRFRNALHRAQMTGQPQFLAKDQQGHDVFVEPPQYYSGYGHPANTNNINPYASGIYQNPNNRFIAPPGAAYGRPYGTRYGGGMGVPIAGGLLGGLLLGGLLF